MDTNDFYFPPNVEAVAICHTEGCIEAELALNIVMVEGSNVTCAGCEQNVTDITQTS